MTTYNTGNPLGSADPRDLFDNAENLDGAVNSTTSDTWVDRLGVTRKTFKGMENDFQSFLLSSGYEDLGAYQAGIQVTARNQIILSAGEYWRVAASTELPYTTTGAGMPEGGAFVSVGDAVLRQDLAAPGGAGLIGFQSAGANSVPSTVEERLRKSIAPEDFLSATAAAAAAITGRYQLSNFNFDATITVGTTGDFASINDALTQATRMVPTFKHNGVLIEVRLLTGFVMAEQVFVRSQDLSFVVITSEDAEVSIQRSALTVDPGIYGISDRSPAFCAVQGGKLPRISALFSMDSSGAPNSQVGIMCVDSSEVVVTQGAGVKNSAGAGLSCYFSSRAVAHGGIFTGSITPGQGGVGIASWGASLVAADGADVSGSYYGVAAARGGELSFVGGVASNCERHGIRADEIGRVNAYQATVLNSGSRGVYAWQGSIIQANSATVTGSTSSNVAASNGSIVVCRGAVLTGAGVNGIYADSGSIVDADSSFGEVSAVDVSGAAKDGIYCAKGSTVSATGIIASNCGRHGVRAEDRGTVHCQGATASGAVTGSGFVAVDSSVINAPFSTATGCAQSGATAVGMSDINVEGSTLTGSGSRGLYCLDVSRINARNANAQKGGAPVVTDIVVERGGIISAHGATGGISVTANVITGAGIIFN